MSVPDEVPRTKHTRSDEPDTIPTVSATGMPRVVPRDADERDPFEQAEKNMSEAGSPPSELSSDEPQYQPSGSLTLAALSPSSNMSLARRAALLTSSLLINLGLPFINGVMLGFGEIFARVIIAPALGITNIGWSGDTSRATVNNRFRPASQNSASTPPRSWHTAGAGSSGSMDSADLSAQVNYDEL